MCQYATSAGHTIKEIKKKVLKIKKNGGRGGGSSLFAYLKPSCVVWVARPAPSLELPEGFGRATPKAP